MKVYLNGALLPADAAKISVFDRGFLFGDGIYEVIPVYGGRPFRVAEHLQRLQRSLDALRIPNPHDTAQWQAIFKQLLAEQPGSDASLYLQITRGVDSPRDHAIAEQLEPTVFAQLSPLKGMPDSVREHGVSVMLTEDIRWQRCDIKAITLLANVLLRQQAADAGCNEALLMRGDQVVEGATSNLFTVKNGVIVTPPNGHSLLPGVTRQLVVELAAGSSLPLQERALSVADLLSADEVWITSSTREVYPVTRIFHDAVEQQVGNGKPGPGWAQMLNLIGDYKRRYAAGDFDA